MYRCSCGGKCVAMLTARESGCCLEISEIEDKMSELQTLDPSSEAMCITEHPVFSGVCWTCGYCRQLLIKFAIPMVKVQLLEQDPLTSMLPVDHYQHSVNYILSHHTVGNTATSRIDN